MSTAWVAARGVRRRRREGAEPDWAGRGGQTSSDVTTVDFTSTWQRGWAREQGERPGLGAGGGCEGWLEAGGSETRPSRSSANSPTRQHQPGSSNSASLARPPTALKYRSCPHNERCPSRPNQRVRLSPVRAWLDAPGLSSPPECVNMHSLTPTRSSCAACLTPSTTTSGRHTTSGMQSHSSRPRATMPPTTPREAQPPATGTPSTRRTRTGQSTSSRRSRYVRLNA